MFDGRGLHPPAIGAGPQYQPQAATTSAKNPNKRYNNWKMCGSCGFDLPKWHTSKTCPAECRWLGHQEGITRQNYQAYVAAGHKVCMKGSHKTVLPTAPAAWQND